MPPGTRPTTPARHALFPNLDDKPLSFKVRYGNIIRLMSLDIPDCDIGKAWGRDGAKAATERLDSTPRPGANAVTTAEGE